MTTPMPIVPVIALEIKRTADLSGENLVIGQVGSVAAQMLKVVSSHFFLDLVPLLMPFA